MITKTGAIKDLESAAFPNAEGRVRYAVDLDFAGAIKRFFGKHATLFEKLYVRFDAIHALDLRSLC